MSATLTAPTKTAKADTDVFVPVLFNNARSRNIRYIVPGTGGTGVVDPITKKERTDEALREVIEFQNGVGWARTPRQAALLREVVAQAMDGTYEALPGYAHHCGIQTCGRLWNNPTAHAECINSHGGTTGGANIY